MDGLARGPTGAPLPEHVGQEARGKVKEKTHHLLSRRVSVSKCS